ncbi:hypothetical protein HGA64_01355 [Candidatus Falkowbacteria bacterium]|nr:hypothetical protein [Candidatus Falkowbacteria bacterium]
MAMENLRMEKPSSPKERLLEMEKSGLYVFHGSPQLLDNLSPKQATGYDEEKDIHFNDGEEAVVSSQYAEIAIFRALTHQSQFPEGVDTHTGFGADEDGPCFRANKAVIDGVKNNSGYVYVFKKDDFTPYKEIEYRTNKDVTPLEIIRVTAEDLPSNIEISKD